VAIPSVSLYTKVELAVSDYNPARSVDSDGTCCRSQVFKNLLSGSSCEGPRGDCCDRVAQGAVRLRKIGGYGVQAETSTFCIAVGLDKKLKRFPPTLDGWDLRMLIPSQESKTTAAASKAA
jgi:hypothetical protein